MFVYKTTLLLALSFLPAQVAAECVNADADTFKYFFENKERSCKNIRIKESRRQALCPDEKVNQSCPQTCGACCEDQDDFTFTRINGLVGTCEWLAEKQNRKDKYCSNIKIGFPSSTQGTVRDGCPVTCDFCFEEIKVATVSPAPTVTASGAPSGTPSSVPTGGPSAVPTGMPSPTPTEEPTRPPSPMPSPFPTLRPTSEPSGSPSDLPSIYPSETPSMVPSDQPSDVPSMMPSDMPSMVPSDQPSDVPSKMPSDVPSLAPSKTPSDQPSNNPTMSIKPSPLPSAAPVGATDAPTEAPVAPACVNDSTFKFTLVNEGHEEGCGWITDHNRVATRRKNYCDTDPTIETKCPQACGTCVADDPDYRFKLSKMKVQVGCDWITKNDSKVSIRMSYCDRPTVAAGCAATCA